MIERQWDTDITFEAFVHECLGASSVERQSLLFDHSTLGGEKYYVSPHDEDVMVDEQNQVYTCNAMLLSKLDCPPFKDDVRQTISFVMNFSERVDPSAGEYVFRQDQVQDYQHPLVNSLQGDMSVRVRALPHYCFSKVDSVHDYKTFIVFPGLYVGQLHLEKPGVKKLEFEELEYFINRLFLPAAKKVLNKSIYNKLHLSYKDSLGYGLRPDTFQHLRSQEVFREIRTQVSQNQDQASYRNFFFVTQTHGGKEVLNNQAIIEDLGRHDLDWTLIRRSTEYSGYVDIGFDFSFENTDGSPMVSFYKIDKAFRQEYGTLSSLVFEPTSGDEKYYSQHLSSLFGNFVCKPTQESITKIMGYSDIKNIVYLRGNYERHFYDFDHISLQKREKNLDKTSIDKTYQQEVLRRTAEIGRKQDVPFRR
ncbi:hypothetical protein BD560DRAFT_494242 [Blakeslea trispora]|nr:hypothetical protein BD560DRAFT_494242 [Blakeslea trispora]